MDTEQSTVSEHSLTAFPISLRSILLALINATPGKIWLMITEYRGLICSLLCNVKSTPKMDLEIQLSAVENMYFDINIAFVS